jgi:cytochrome c oxidase subunit 1
VLAHFHYTFYPIAIIATFAGVTYWFPKMFGRHMNERLGKIHSGERSSPSTSSSSRCSSRDRSATTGDLQLQPLPRARDAVPPGSRIVATVALVVMLCFQFIFLYNYISSAFRGPKAEKNPWKANTLEWYAASPPPHGTSR